MKLATNTRKGMSLPELIAVIIVIAIIGGIALNVISGLSDEAKKSKGAANVAELNRLVSNIKAAGGTVDQDNQADVDTTSPTTALASLKAGYDTNGAAVGGVVLALDNNFTMTVASYSVTADGLWTFNGGEP